MLLRRLVFEYCELIAKKSNSFFRLVRDYFRFIHQIPFELSQFGRTFPASLRLEPYDVGETTSWIGVVSTSMGCLKMSRNVLNERLRSFIYEINDINDIECN